MNHRLFEQWITERPPLTPNEQSALQQHLQECPTCFALWQVDGLLREAPAISPSPGFSERWQARLQEKVNEAPQAPRPKLLLPILLIALLSLVAGALLPTPNGPQLIPDLIHAVAQTASTALFYSRAFLLLLKTAFTLIPLPYWFFLFASSIGALALWSLSLRHAQLLWQEAQR